MAADGLPVLSTTVTLTGSARGDRDLPAQQGMILNNMRFPDNGVDVLQTAAIDAPAMPAPTTTTSGSFVRILTPPRGRPPCVRRARFRPIPSCLRWPPPRTTTGCRDVGNVSRYDHDLPGS